MRSSLVLNASYEPLSVVPARRAACLVLAEKAELVECDGLLIRSASLTLASPLVIRLRYMVKVPYRRKASLSRRGCVRPRRLSMPVLRRARRLDRSRDAAFTRRPARVGERGGGVPAVQPGQTRPHSGRGRDAPVAAVPGAAGDGVGRRQHHPRARGMEAVPGAGILSWALASSPASAARPADFHARELPDVAAVWQFDVEHPAIVLGSRQTEDVLDVAACRRRQVEVARPSLGRRRRAARARCDGLDRRRRARWRPSLGRRRPAVDGADRRTMGRGAAMVSSTAS